MSRKPRLRVGWTLRTREKIIRTKIRVRLTSKARL
jgi:hypothetical protein